MSDGGYSNLSQTRADGSVLAIFPGGAQIPTGINASLAPNETLAWIDPTDGTTEEGVLFAYKETGTGTGINPGRVHGGLDIGGNAIGTNVGLRLQAQNNDVAGHAATLAVLFGQSPLGRTTNFGSSYVAPNGLIIADSAGGSDFLQLAVPTPGGANNRQAARKLALNCGNGTANFVTGLATITQPHGLGVVPQFASITCSNADANNVAYASLSSWDASNMTFTAATRNTGVSGLIGFTWMALG